MRKLILVFLISAFGCLSCFAQKDTTYRVTPIDTSQENLRHYTDSAVLARQHFVEDSLMMQFIRYPDPTRHNVLMDSLFKQGDFNPYSFSGHHLKKTMMQSGKERPVKQQWIIAVIIILLIYTGILNIIIGKDIYGVLRAFYSKRAFASITTEDSLLTSWAFIALFSLFGFTIGLYLYQLITYKQLSLVSFDITGFELFFTLSVVVISLFVIKILVLRILGFIFDIGRIVKEYIAILYLTYFNVAFIFLPLVLCFSLISSDIKPYLLLFSYALITLIFLIQYLRSTVNIISKFRFRKIYLFLYLCALEICPILIIIKALDL